MEQTKHTKGQTAVALAGYGGWDVTSYPYGGEFCRPQIDLPGTVLDVCTKYERGGPSLGDVLMEVERHNRKGTRRVWFGSQGIKATGQQ